MNQSTRATGIFRSQFSYRAFWTAMAIFMVTSILAFKLGTMDAAKFAFVWIFPIGAGMISIIMGTFGIKQIVSNKQMTGYWFAITAILMGFITPFIGWWFIIFGEIYLKGPLVY